MIAMWPASNYAVLSMGLLMVIIQILGVSLKGEFTIIFV